MEAYDIAWLTIASIFWIWSGIWLVYFKAKYKEIRKLLNYKEYIGVLGLFLIALGLVIEIILYDPEAEYYSVLAFPFILAGNVVLIIWVIWAIYNIIEKIEEIKENIAIFGFVIAFILDLTTPFTILFLIIIYSFRFFWSGTMIFTLINIDKFREKEIEVEQKEITIREEKEKVPIIAEQIDIKKRDEIYECPMCKSKIPAILSKKYSMGSPIFCKYCGSKID